MRSKVSRLVRRARERVLGRSTASFLRDGANIGFRFLPNGAIISPNDCPFVTIGDYVTFGPSVLVLAHDAALRDHIGWTRVSPVVVGDHVFVGARSIILPGVTIGTGSIVAAGSVVTKDISAGEVWGGAPARYISSVQDVIDRRTAQLGQLPQYDQGWTLRIRKLQDRAAMQREVRAAGGGWVY